MADHDGFYEKTMVSKESRFSFQCYKRAKLLISRNTSGFINTWRVNTRVTVGIIWALHYQLCWFTSSRFLFTTKDTSFPSHRQGFGRLFPLLLLNSLISAIFSALPLPPPQARLARPHLILPIHEDCQRELRLSMCHFPSREL